jgi:hypothetical protein
LAWNEKHDAAGNDKNSPNKVSQQQESEMRFFAISFWSLVLQGMEEVGRQSAYIPGDKNNAEYKSDKRDHRQQLQVWQERFR